MLLEQREAGPMLREAVAQLAREPASPGAGGRTWRVSLAHRPGYSTAPQALWVRVTNDRGEHSYFGRMRLKGVAGTEEETPDGPVLVIVGAKLWAADDGMTAIFKPAAPPAKKKRRKR